MQMNKMRTEKEEIEASYRTVYTINQDVKSGDIITEDMLQLSIAQLEHIPNNATATLDTFVNYTLTDNEGNKVYSDEMGTFLLKNSNYMEVYKDEQNNKYYTYSFDGKKVEVLGISAEELKTDAYGTYVIRDTERKTRLYQEELTGKYYVLKVKYNTNSEKTASREKEYVDILGTPLLAKITMNKNTVLTLDMLSLGELVTDDVRKQEYNSVILPTDLTSGDYIDIRVQLPNGQDFIVLSKKVVEIPFIDNMESQDTIWLNLPEDEILSMACAIVETYRINGAKLYATKYTDPGIQEAAIPTYPLSAETVKQIKADPNVTAIAQNALKERYTQALVDIRNETINKELNKEGNTQDNVVNKMNESIVKTQEERRKYLQSISGIVEE